MAKKTDAQAAGIDSALATFTAEFRKENQRRDPNFKE
jgi:hypothetical protein